MDLHKITLVAEWLKASESTVILTGAGMSTESGIPDFRSREGWWKKIDPMTVSTIEALENEYELFHGFYSLRLTDLKTCHPHKGHHLLAEWEKHGLVKGIVTQNVDGFHQEAGNKNVHELHGSLRSIFCSDCGQASEEGSFLNHAVCAMCGGHLRPEIILFGEMLPQDTWGKAIRLIEDSDLLIVIGSSLQVSPANELPFLTNGKKVIINNEATLLSEQFDLQLEGKAGDILEAIDEKQKGGDFS
ncbi:NAD-dependent deacylase [Bacillus sp. Marseille-Q3570]|uniref:SIR2 family NAD-dependent protein deacylase n=1 Tax=Bacillus sp. Marseille-Q3570 TaxID=2963522 RepID=UPI0021B83B8F|nr:NAD-dependent deacylase [Bacillus sp. Marseille-Q3570]